MVFICNIVLQIKTKPYCFTNKKLYYITSPKIKKKKRNTEIYKLIEAYNNEPLEESCLDRRHHIGVKLIMKLPHCFINQARKNRPYTS